MLLFASVAICTLLWYGCESIANYPIDTPSPQILNDKLIGKWKIQEDTNADNYYEIYKADGRSAENQYHVRWWDRGGTNPTYEGNVYFSNVAGSMFLNVPYREEGFTNQGYLFIKILSANPAYDKVTTATFYDTTMRSLKSMEDVRRHITKHLNDAKFYNDTSHFYKVK